MLHSRFIYDRRTQGASAPAWKQRTKCKVPANASDEDDRSQASGKTWDTCKLHFISSAPVSYKHHTRYHGTDLQIVLIQLLIVRINTVIPGAIILLLCTPTRRMIRIVYWCINRSWRIGARAYATNCPTALSGTALSTFAWMPSEARPLARPRQNSTAHKSRWSWPNGTYPNLIGGMSAHRREQRHNCSSSLPTARRQYVYGRMYTHCYCCVCCALYTHCSCCVCCALSVSYTHLTLPTKA